MLCNTIYSYIEPYVRIATRIYFFININAEQISFGFLILKRKLICQYMSLHPEGELL